MAYVNLSRDFSDVRRVVSGTGLTKRQIIALFLGLVTGLPVFFLMKYIFHTETMTAVFGMVLLIFPIFFFVTHKKDGLYMERHLLYYYETHFKRNTERPYITSNLYELKEKNEAINHKIDEILYKGKTKMEIQKIKETGKEAVIRAGKTKIRVPVEGRLDRRTKRELERTIRKAKLKGDIPESAQDTIPYRNIYKDGIMESEKGFFTLTVAFEDINYQLLDNDPKNTLFEWWCRLINSFDYEIPFQFTYANMEIDTKAHEEELRSGMKEDSRISREYTQMLISQYQKSTNYLETWRLLTFGVYAPDVKTARVRLGKILKHVQRFLRRIQSKNHVLDGYERLNLFYRMFHPGTNEPLMWNFDMPVHTGLSSKDFIAPSSFSFRDAPNLNATKYFRVGDRVGAVSYLKTYASDLEDRIISDLLSHNGNVLVSIHAKAYTRKEAIDKVKNDLTDIQSMIINRQKDASGSGYSMDILPPELQMYQNAGEDLYHSLQRKDEQLYLSVITVVLTAHTRKELESAVFDLNQTLQPYQCSLVRLDNRQEQGYITSLPFGINRLEIKRSFTTTDLAIFIPFTTKELYDPGGQYYGMNSLSNNVIMIDKKLLVNPNSLILGAPGYGKSFATKREILDDHLRTDDDILVVDPEGEYADTVEELHGQVIKISLASDVFINAMEIHFNPRNEDDSDYDPVASKCGFVESMSELILGNNSVLSKKQLSTIDRACNNIYERYKENGGKMPTLGTLYEELRNIQGDEAMKSIGLDLSIALSRYVDGSLSYFNHESNVDLNNRLICFDLKDMDASQKDLTMLIIQELIWNKVARNREIGRFTRVMIDEFHLLLRNPKTAEYCVEIWKRFRKWNGIPAGITQNIKDLFRSPEIQNILDTTNFIMMLNQNGDDAKLLAEHIDLSEEEMSYIKSGEPGKGLLWVEGVKVPFEDDFPKNTHLYRIMTTKATETAKIARKKKGL